MPPRYFPNPEIASSEGLVATGGVLSPEFLLDAYRHGIFPWPVEGMKSMLWWSPDPRAILPLDQFHASRRLLRRIRSGRFTITSDRAFRDVMIGCATAAGRKGRTWITPQMISAYGKMYHLGHAHSVEVWHENALVGGVYGVTVGGLFAAESKFYRVRDASKMALYRLVQHLRSRGYQLLDVQQWTAHTARLGVIEIPRREYLHRLAEVVDLPTSFGTLASDSSG